VPTKIKLPANADIIPDAAFPFFVVVSIANAAIYKAWPNEVKWESPLLCA